MAKLSKNVFKKVYSLHKALGLFVSVHALLLGITGVALVWKHEIDGIGQAQATTSTSVSTIESFTHVENSVNSKIGERKILAIYKTDSTPAQWVARVGEKNQTKFRGSLKLAYDSNGNEVVKPEKEGALMNLILELHRELLLGTWGKFYIGFVGILMGVAMITGFLILPGFNRKKNAFKLTHKNGRLGSSEKHQFLGVGLWGWLAVVAASGVFLSFNGILIKAYFNGELKKFEREVLGQNTAKGRVGIAHVVSSLEKAAPEFSPHFISYPKNEFSLENSFVALLEKKGREREQKLAVVEAASGKVLELKSLPLILQILTLSEPLHFGDYGGIPLKLGWSVLGIAFIYFSLTGIKVFLFRKKFINTNHSKVSKTSVKSKGPVFYFVVAVGPAAALVTGYFLEGVGGTVLRLGFLAFVVGLALNFYKNIKQIRL